jgi:hypothetical protein
MEPDGIGGFGHGAGRELEHRFLELFTLAPEPGGVRKRLGKHRGEESQGKKRGEAHGSGECSLIQRGIRAVEGSLPLWPPTAEAGTGGRGITKKENTRYPR